MSAGNINEISFNGWFWVKFDSGLISFDWDGLPRGVHFTVSFNEGSPDINFHITKNVGDGTNKPKIEIARIAKKLFGEWLKEKVPLLPSLLLDKMLEPLDIIEIKNKYGDNVEFISFDNLTQDNLPEQMLLEKFSDISKIKKTKLKIKGDIERKFESFITSDKLNDFILDNTINLKTGVIDKLSVGAIVSGNNVIPIVQRNDQWHSLNENLDRSELIKEFITPELLQHLNLETKRAIVIIQKTKMCDDTKTLNMSVRLEINENTRKLHL